MTTTKISSLRTIRTFLRLGTCSETVCNALDLAYAHPLADEERAAQPLAGGLMQGYQCGQLWGAALGAGAQAYHQLGPGPRAEAAAVTAAQRIVETFRHRYKEINCLELTGIDLKSAQKMTLGGFLKVLFEGRVTRCFSMAAGCAQLSYQEINTVLSAELAETPSRPVSCASVLVETMGASDLQTTMAAGFAGGIGLSGGACGALGAAVWISAMRKSAQGQGFGSDGTSEIIDRFVESADYEFECAKITGKRFENVQDHAQYIRDGGCARIIHALAHL